MELQCILKRVYSYPSIVILVLAELMAVQAFSWQNEWHPNSRVELIESDKSLQWFRGNLSYVDDFRLLLTEDDSMLLGARNAVFNVSLVDLKNFWKIDWPVTSPEINHCKIRHKTEEECQNYVRVIVKTDRNRLQVCGTHAFRPRCQAYIQKRGGKYVMSGDETDGRAKCPYDPAHNNTAVYANGKLYTATVSDFSARDPLIIENSTMIRSEQHDSKWLNEPNFISSFDIDDKIYFFFHETAVEHINCGKAVFSRVARVCKNDMGGEMLLSNTWTSFFKARLNCSIPGDFPFYFDEIQATSDLGQGKFRPTFDSGDRSDMIYAVFSTPRNSVRASAVCAFRYADIVNVFKGRFKGQQSAWHNWLPVSKENAPEPHPERCTNHSRKLKDTTLNFIKSHPLMDEAVPSAAGMPLMIQASFSSQFNQIAIDWQVHAADDRYYDVMFVGTDDGRVIKGVNKALSRNKKVESVVIEDIQVFKDKSPVVNLKVFRRRGIEKLIVVSKNDVVSIPLHRCHQQKSCRGCVRLQDPYCSWTDGKCSNTDRGLLTFNMDEMSAMCVGEPDEEGLGDNIGSTARPAPLPTQAPCKNDIIKDEPNVGENRQRVATGGTSTEIVAVAVVVSIVVSMLAGFAIGYKVSSCRNSRNIDSPFERNLSLQKSRNRLSSGEHPPYFKDPDSPFTPKQFNYVVNVKPGKLNSGVETKPVTKSNKVYL